MNKKSLPGENNIVLMDCPFCGRTPDINFNFMGCDNTVIWCPNCYCQTPPYPMTTDAFKAWNTRTPDPLLTEALGVLRDITERMARWDGVIQLSPDDKMRELRRNAEAILKTNKEGSDESEG